MELTLIVAACLAGAFLLFIGAGLRNMIHHRMHRVGWFLYCWRYASGMPWHGQHETNARWFKRGHGKALTRTGYARKFYYRPRIARAGMRLSYPLLPIALIAGFVLDWKLTAGLLVAGVLALIGYGLWRAVRAVQARSFRHEWLTPAHESLASLIGIPSALKPKDWIDLSLNREHVTFALPEGFNETDTHKDRIVSMAASKLGMEEPDPTWMLRGRQPTLTLDASDPPPREVYLRDVMSAIRNSAANEIILGVGRKKASIDVSLHDDSPHIGTSMGPGAGKSTLAKFMAAQALYKGAIVIILDIKRTSHPWARNLSNVAYFDTPEAIHDGFIWLDGERKRRGDLILATSDFEGNTTANVGPRIIIIAEELNATANELNKYWKNDLNGQGVSPALRAMQNVAFTGREFRMNFAMIGQMLTARVTGGTSGGNEARESVGIRILGRYTKKAWDMLVPEHPMPIATSVPGRIQVIAGGIVRECQVARLSGAEARELAMSGDVARLPSNIPGAPVIIPEADSRKKAIDAPDNENVNVPIVNNPTPVTISEAVSMGYLKMTLKAARQMRFRDPNFPKPLDYIPEGRAKNAHYYDPMTLEDYQATKSKKGK
jgi:hypothetical protein